jgi:hypothetical protein
VRVALTCSVRGAVFSVLNRRNYATTM